MAFHNSYQPFKLHIKTDDEILLFCWMNYYLNLLIPIFVYTGLANFNPEPTYTILGSQNTTGTRIAISPDESVLAVGFGDGTFKILGIMLNEVCLGSLNNLSQITDLIWLPTFGPVTLDKSNTITLWSLDCSITNQIFFTQPIRDITGHQTQSGDENGTIWGVIAANFQNRIQQYNIQTGIQLLVYTIPAQQKSLEMIYNADGEDTILLVGTNASVIRKFEIQNGTEVGVFLVESSIWMMAKISVYTGDVVIGIAQNHDIIRFDSNGQVLDRGHYPLAVSLTICPATKQFALAMSQSRTVSLYLYAGQIQQTITSLQGLPQSIDCSASYLVTLDEDGAVHVYKYEQFKSHIIAIIGGVLGGIVFLVILVIVVMKYRSKLNRDKHEQQYKSTMKNKYPKTIADSTPKKQPSMQMLKLSTMETTMRE